MISAVADGTITILHQDLVPDYPYDEPDFVICFGYRFIVKEPFLSRWKDKIINIHISLLPWNRGASPNLWAWYDGTPHGVSIHMIDDGIDTGPVLAQREVRWFDQDRTETLLSSYETLKQEAGNLFADCWLAIRNNRLASLSRPGRGSFHTVKQSKELLNKFRNGYDTACWEVAEAGKNGRETSPGIPVE